jgi:hypothetical protein
MRVPTVRGIIDRRILVNYRVAPAVLTGLVPPPFRPKLVNEMGMAGVCLIRLQHIRPSALPPLIGLSSENAAHRIAVEWDERGERREGVYIPRRDSSSWLSTLIGGRLFPAVLHHARFQVAEADDHFQVELDSDDGQTHLAVAGHVSEQLPAESVFGSLQEASTFFERGATGYAATPRRGEYDGLELQLAGRAAGDRARRIQLLRRRPAIPRRRGAVRLCPADAANRARVARAGIASRRGDVAPSSEGRNARLGEPARNWVVTG